MYPQEQELDQDIAPTEVLLHDFLLMFEVFSSRRRYHKWAQIVEAWLISYPIHILLTSLFEPRLAVEALVWMLGDEE